MKIIQTHNKVNLDSVKDNIVVLDIKYKGVFSGEVHGNTVCGINGKRMLIVFMSPPEEELMTYEGDFKIITFKAYDENGDEIRQHLVSRMMDDFKISKSKWSVSDTKYEDFNKTNKYKKIQKTELKYTRMGKEIKLNDKNKEIIRIGNVRK